MDRKFLALNNPELQTADGRFFKPKKYEGSWLDAADFSEKFYDEHLDILKYPVSTVASVLIHQTGLVVNFGSAEHARYSQNEFTHLINVGFDTAKVHSLHTFRWHVSIREPREFATPAPVKNNFILSVHKFAPCYVNSSTVNHQGRRSKFELDDSEDPYELFGLIQETLLVGTNELAEYTRRRKENLKPKFREIQLKALGATALNGLDDKQIKLAADIDRMGFPEWIIRMNDNAV